MTEQTIAQRVAAHQRARILRDAHPYRRTFAPTAETAEIVYAYDLAARRQEAIGNGQVTK